MPAPSPVVRVEPDTTGVIAGAAGTSEGTIVRLQHQLDLLKLVPRYDCGANTYLANHATALRDAFDSGGATMVKCYLESQATSDFQRFHANHWSAVVLSELSTHAEFCGGGFKDQFSAHDMPQAPSCPTFREAS